MKINSNNNLLLIQNAITRSVKNDDDEESTIGTTCDDEMVIFNFHIEDVDANDFDVVIADVVSSREFDITVMFSV